jgi:CBS domain-containing protein
MPKVFDRHVPPFDRLTGPEIEDVRASLDVGYFRPGDVLLHRGAPAEALYVVIKGAIEERDGAEIIDILGPKRMFDSRAVVQGACAHDFIAAEETLAYVLPREKALDLMRRNAAFAAHFYRETSDKLEAFASRTEMREVGALMRAHVAELTLSPAVEIEGDRSLAEAGHLMNDCHVDALIVHDNGRTGIATGMTLAKAMVLEGKPLTARIGDVARFELVTVSPQDFVATALVAMTRHNKRRLVVREGDTFLGFLEDIHLLGFIAGSSPVVTGRIERASSVADLAPAAREISAQVERLHRQGLKVQAIAEITSDLNRRLLRRVFEITAPEAIKRKGCLIVMGSEGRGEQTVRTDQDNGLLLAEPVDPAELDAFRRRFSDALISYGFPPCPGHVMVSNPYWSRTIDEFESEFRRWAVVPEEKSFLNTAIFYDAQAVGGDARLLDHAKHALVETLKGEKVWLGHFARAIEQFAVPVGFFRSFITAEGKKGDALDVKKGGIFPIVHGIRAIALELGLTETSTCRRIELVSAWGVFGAEFAHELTQAFLFLSELKLDAKLKAQRGVGDGLVRPSEMSAIERDLLRDALYAVKQFRDIVRRHFNLSVF